MAARTGHSEVSIDDWVLPDTGSPLMPAFLDIVVLVVSLSIKDAILSSEARFAQVELEHA